MKRGQYDQPEALMMDPRQFLSNSSIYSAFQARLQKANSRARVQESFLRIKPGQRVLDIGCGPADILAYLPDGVDYHGYDSEPNYIATARDRYAGRGSFAIRDVSSDTVDDIGTFDVVMALGVVHHLSDADADILFATAAKVLRQDGHVVTLDPAFLKGQSPIARLLATLDRGEHVRTPDLYLSIARRHFQQVSATVLHDLIAVPYTHCILEAKIPLPSG
jgi:cyclopropane fatty-acyl-phospholipid synthase-like methyltransferase